MPVINLLSQSTIDKIAAGEVVERPLSVVKELTENAIDAKANAITVEIKDGGISFIRVTDNGCGIPKDQVKKAFLRHATSKITSIEDLSYVESLGFRGEALSSIAAVAQVEVLTKTPDDITGMRYNIAGGVEEEPEEVGVPAGTTFLVRNLFFNTPVRKKFLKQPQTEGGYVSDMMEHLALSRPDISIKFVQNGQVKFHTSGNGDLKEVIYRIYGKDITQALIPFEKSGDGFGVSGFLGKPEINRSNRNFEVYFVNGRFVKNDVITKAVEEGYRAYVMQHKFPFFVLHFTMVPDRIDVNVHPAKMEIRLIQGSEFYNKISKWVGEGLHAVELIPNVRLVEEKNKPIPALKTPEPFEVRRIAMLMDEPAEYKTAATDSAGCIKTETMTEKNASKKPKAEEFLHKIVQNKIIGNENAGSFGSYGSEKEDLRANVIKADKHILVEKAEQLGLFENNFLSKDAKNDYQILGQIFGTYWLVAFKDKLFIIDQHAAHEKVKYERLMGELEKKEASSQMLNPPVIVDLTGKEEALLEEYLPYFKEMGFEIEEFGGGAWAIRSMPVDLYGNSEKELFMNILDELAVKEAAGRPEAVLEKLASMACKAAVKGNHQMSFQEMEALIEELLSLDNPYHCPHGRPTIISMSKYEIEKKFKRIV